MFTQLQEAKDDLLTIFETSGTAMAIIEEDTTISRANKKVVELVGYSKEEIEGKSCTEFIAGGDLERMKEYHRLRRDNPDAAPGSYEFSLRPIWEY